MLSPAGIQSNTKAQKKAEAVKPNTFSFGFQPAEGPSQGQQDGADEHGKADESAMDLQIGNGFKNANSTQQDKALPQTTPEA